MPRPAPSRTDFHRLTVARVDPLTADAAAVTFDVPPRLAEKFGSELGYVVRFDSDAIKSMAITVMINMSERASR